VLGPAEHAAVTAANMQLSGFSVIAVWHGTITLALASPADQGEDGSALIVNK